MVMTLSNILYILLFCYLPSVSVTNSIVVATFVLMARIYPRHLFEVFVDLTNGTLNISLCMSRYFDASHEAVFRQRDVGGSGRLHQVCDGDYENHCWCTGYHFISKVLDQTLPRLGRRIEGIQTGFTAYSGNILYEAKSPAQKVFSPYDRF
jgi:hypothetical protein